MRTAPAVPTIAPPQAHYSHVVVSAPGSLLWVAGQVPVSADGDLVGGGDAGAQARQVLDNLDAVLRAAGSDLDHVVKTTTFLVDLADRQAVGAARRERFGEPAPANSLLVVRSLAHPDFLVEIEAVAVLPDGA